MTLDSHRPVLLPEGTEWQARDMRHGRILDYMTVIQKYKGPCFWNINSSRVKPQLAQPYFMQRTFHWFQVNMLTYFQFLPSLWNSSNFEAKWQLNLIVMGHSMYQQAGCKEKKQHNITYTSSQENEKFHKTSTQKRKVLGASSCSFLFFFSWICHCAWDDGKVLNTPWDPMFSVCVINVVHL